MECRFYEIHDIRLGKDAAFGSDMVQLRIVKTQPAYFVCRHPYFDHALVNRGARTGCAFVIHRGKRLLIARFFVLLENDNLRILSSELDDAPDIGMEMLHGHRDRIDLLHKFRTDMRSDRSAAGARREDTDIFRLHIREFVADGHQQLQHFFCLLRMMALIIRPYNLLAVRIHHGRFDRR